MHNRIRSLLPPAVLLALLSGCASTAYVPTPPPRARVEHRGTQPGPEHVWVAGHWKYSGHDYAWVKGRWEEARENRGDWVAGRWVKKPRGWIWVPGYWK